MKPSFQEMSGGKKWNEFAYSLDEVPESNDDATTKTQQIFPIKLVVHKIYSKRQPIHNPQSHKRDILQHRETVNDTDIYIEVITQLFSHRPVYQARASTTARDVAVGSYWPRALYRANMKTAV